MSQPQDSIGWDKFEIDGVQMDLIIFLQFSFTAYVLVRELKKFANSSKRTVIFTINQPSSDIWRMLD